MDEAAREGHLEIIEYAHDNDCPWGLSTAFNAVSRGDLQMLRYGTEHGMPLNRNTFFEACAKGNMDVLRCIFGAAQNHMEFGPRTFHPAVSNGHLEAVKFLHGRGCLGPRTICGLATKHGHLHILVYAREQLNCEWGPNTWALANTIQRQERKEPVTNHFI